MDEPNKRLSGVIGGMRRLHDSGLDELEAARAGEIATCVKVGYQPCRDFGSTGRCQYGDRCRFFHVQGVSDVK